MSIPGQQAINIGLPNESTNSDSLYTAFTTTNTNFATLFACASPYINFVGGTGISASSNATTGTVTTTNTGVTSIIAGTNITINRSNGAVTISSTGGGGGGGGTVTSVGLAPISSSRLVVADSPIVSSGVISIDLATSGATAGTYTNPSVTVDTYGRVTGISSGPASGTVTSVGLTAGPGVQVNGGPVTTAGNIVVTNTGVIRLTAGSGITLSSANGNITVSTSGIQGTVTSVGIYSTSLTVTGGPITTSGEIRVELPTNPSATGTFTAGNLVTSGTLNVTGDSTFGNIQASNSIFTSNVTAGNVYANSGTIGASLLTGTLTTAAQPNITSVGTLGSLAVTGNITSGNANLGNNVTANFFTGSGQFLTALQATNISGTVAAAANATRVSTTLQTTGIYYLPFISATASSNYALNSNAAFSANLANGGITATTFIGSLSGAATTAGTVTTAAQGNITSVGTLTGLGVNGTVTAVNITANTGVFTGNGSGLSAIAGANVTGTVSSATSATTAGTVTTAAQGNITSVGTLTSLTSSGNISGANIVATSYNIRSINIAVSAAGTTQGTATALTKEINVVSIVASGSGVVLPTAVAGMVLIINNTSANTLNVYPATGGAINNVVTNSPYSHGLGASLQYYATSTTQWYTVGASYA